MRTLSLETLIQKYALQSAYLLTPQALRREIVGLCAVTDPKPAHISYALSARHLKSENLGTLAALIIPKKLLGNQLLPNTHLIISANPELTAAKLAAYFSPPRDWQQPSSVHKSAVIDDSAQIHPNAHIGANAVIGAHSHIGADTYIGPNCTISNSVMIGERTIIQSNNFIGERVEVGNDCWVHPGAIIGSEGFGFVPTHGSPEGDWHRIPHLGTVLIGNRVEIGANTTVDRGAISDTVIMDDAILDNQIQVAHNVQIGNSTAMAGCVGIAGSAIIGKNCLIGGGSGIAGHLNIPDGTRINGMSFVSRTLVKSGEYASGIPVMETSRWNKIVAKLRRLISKTSDTDT